MFKKDGTFVKEFQVEPQTLQNGSLWDLVLSEDRAQRYIFVTDGANMQVPTIDRQTDLKLGTFGPPGHMAGNFKWCTTWPSTRKAPSTPPKSATAAACKSSSARSYAEARAFRGECAVLLRKVHGPLRSGDCSS